MKEVDNISNPSKNKIIKPPKPIKVKPKENDPN